MQKRIAACHRPIFALSIFAACQGKPSPPATASCDLGGGKSIKTALLQPTHERPQDLWGPRALRPGLAHRRQ